MKTKNEFNVFLNKLDLSLKNFTAQEIKDWRKELEITQQQAAYILGVSKTTYFNYENEKLNKIPLMVRYACERHQLKLRLKELNKLMRDEMGQS